MGFRDMTAIMLATLAALSPAMPAAAQEAPTADGILARLDAAQTYSTLRSEATMSITDSLGTRRTDFINQARGADDTLIEFTSAAEKGQKILKNSKELYLYFPDAEEVMRLQGAALRQSMAGSDISYEDMTGTRTRRLNYTPRLERKEVIDGRTAWLLVLDAKTKNVAYPKQEVWVDAATFLPVMVRSYALSGKLLKELRFSDVRMAGGRPFNGRITVRDMMKTGTKTELLFRKVEVDVPIDPKIFTLENLSW